MVGKMFHYVEEDAQPGFPKTLHGEGLEDMFRRQFFQQKFRPGGQFVELLQQFRFGYRTPLIEFLLTAALVRYAPQAGEQPLPGVATQVKDEVAGTVAVLVRAEPDFGFAQLVEAFFDPRNAFFQQTPPHFGDQ
jgi:hypothetical protein